MWQFKLLLLPERSGVLWGLSLHGCEIEQIGPVGGVGVMKCLHHSPVTEEEQTGQLPDVAAYLPHSVTLNNGGQKSAPPNPPAQ